jgi:hypothetical protein
MEYLHNPLKVISYVDNSRYDVTIKQLLELTKKLKRYLEELIPKGNKINIKEHKEKLIEAFNSISYVDLIKNEFNELYRKFKASQDVDLKMKLAKVRKNNIQYLSFEKNLKKAEEIEEACTISEVKEYMNIVLKIANGDDSEDSEVNDFNYIKLFDQIEGIMVNGTREIYITDLSEKSMNKYIRNRKFSINYSDEETFKNDLKTLKDVYSEEEIKDIAEQIQISKEQTPRFIKYYIGALISSSKARSIEFSWIKGINDNDQESATYKILSALYNKKENKRLYLKNEDRLLNKYKENADKLSGVQSNLKSLYENNKLMEKEMNINFHKDIAPTAWLDLDLCPQKFLYSGIISFYPVYETDFHQRIAFSVIGKLLKSQFEESKDVENYFYCLFPQWNRTMKDNFIETAFKRDIRREYKFKNIFFPYHIKDLQTLRSKIYDNARRKRRNAYRGIAINSEKYIKEFIKEDAKYDVVRSIKGSHCDMCSYNMICCKGEFAIERSNY